MKLQGIPEKDVTVSLLRCALVRQNGHLEQLIFSPVVSCDMLNTQKRRENQ